MQDKSGGPRNEPQTSQLVYATSQQSGVLRPAITCYSFYPHDAMLAQAFATATCPSVCPSVCHMPVLCLAERKRDREMYTI